MSDREEQQNPEKVSFLYALQTDGYDAGPNDDIDYEYMLEKEHRMVQEHVERVFFQMKDYVYEQHERELLQNLTMEDVAMLLYDERYLSQLLQSVESPFI